jgi:hypothetical protein
MLARRLTTILPAMTLAEAIETTRIHRVAGLTGDRTACSAWMHGPSSAAMSWRSYANRLRMVSQEYNFAGVLNLHAFVALAARLVTSVGLGRER